MTKPTFTTNVLAVSSLLLSLLSSVDAFSVQGPSLSTRSAVQQRQSALFVMGDEDLFEDDEEMIDVARNYVRAKVTATGKSTLSKDDAEIILKSLLPPVTPAELQAELGALVANDTVEKDDFVDSVVKNSYWKAAGDLVVKELMYFDALYGYYQTGKSLLENDDYENLKENLTWEGSSVATMNKNEALFVTAVASARRGDPIMEDAEYKSLKETLKGEGSWVVNREMDALEKLGLNTFMGYLHRALN